MFVYWGATEAHDLRHVRGMRIGDAVSSMTNEERNRNRVQIPHPPQNKEPEAQASGDYILRDGEGFELRRREASFACHAKRIREV